MSGYKGRFRVDVDGTIYDGLWVNVEDAAAGACRRHRYAIEKAHYDKCGCDLTDEWHKCEPPILDDVAIVVRRVEETK